MNTATTAESETATRYIGNCQVCARDQKMHGGTMVHHGYKRPGHGFIEGDCPGVHAVPYEVSCELVKGYKAGVERQLANLESYLVALQGGHVTYLTEMQHRSAWKPAALVEFVAGVTDLYRWGQAIQHKVWGVESQIRQCKSEIERCERRIAAWKPMPIRTVEQEIARETADKAARKAEKDAARAARNAKKAATAAKQQALADRRAAYLADLRGRLVALAATPASLDRNLAADKLFIEMAAKKNDWFYLREVKALDAFVALGLATLTGGTNGWNEPCAKYHRTNGTAERY